MTVQMYGRSSVRVAQMEPLPSFDSPKAFGQLFQPSKMCFYFSKFQFKDNHSHLYHMSFAQWAHVCACHFILMRNIKHC